MTDEQKQNAEKVAKDCAVESGMAPEDVQKLRADPKNSVKDPKAQVRQSYHISFEFVV